MPWNPLWLHDRAMLVSDGTVAAVVVMSVSRRACLEPERRDRGAGGCRRFVGPRSTSHRRTLVFENKQPANTFERALQSTHHEEQVHYG